MGGVVGPVLLVVLTLVVGDEAVEVGVVELVVKLLLEVVVVIGLEDVLVDG
jgi:hypothetical protein